MRPPSSLPIPNRGMLRSTMGRSLSAALAGITLPDPDGHEIRLGPLWEQGPAVLAFLRHYG